MNTRTLVRPITQDVFDDTDGARAVWPRPRNTAGQPLPWTSGDVTDPADTHDERISRSHAQHLCQVCGAPLDSSDCYAVLLGTHADQVPSGNTVVEGPGMHGRCLRLSIAVCPPLHSAFHDQDGPLFGFVFLVDPADLAAAYSDKTRNALWKAVTEHAAAHHRTPVPITLDQVSNTGPARAKEAAGD